MTDHSVTLVMGVSVSLVSVSLSPSRAHVNAGVMGSAAARVNYVTAARDAIASHAGSPYLWVKVA
jgi:hypothetical protein